MVCVVYIDVWHVCVVSSVWCMYICGWVIYVFMYVCVSVMCVVCLYTVGLCGFVCLSYVCV